MKTNTTVARYKASPQTLYDLLSKEENLPKWAVRFCTDIERKADDYIITTATGEAHYFKIEADPQTGTIDMASGPSKDQMWNTPTRVVSDNADGSLFIFTFLQPPGMPDEAYAAGCAGLKEEFEVIRSLVE